jgi:tryptophanase
VPARWRAIGSVMFDYLVEAILEVNEHKNDLRGYEIVRAPPFPRHFTAAFRPLGGSAAPG